MHGFSSAPHRHLTVKVGKAPIGPLAVIDLSVCEGYGDGFDDVIIQGDLDELKFVAFYTR